MAPVLEQPAFSNVVSCLVQPFYRIGAKPREKRHVMSPHQHIHGVDLDQAQPFEQRIKVTPRRRRWTCRHESLCRKRYPSSFGGRKSHSFSTTRSPPARSNGNRRLRRILIHGATQPRRISHFAIRNPQSAIRFRLPRELIPVSHRAVMVFYKAYRSILRNNDRYAVGVLIAEPVNGTMAGTNVIERFFRPDQARSRTSGGN